MQTADEGHDESFRDSIATIGKDGKRAWIYAQKPKGRLYNARTVLSFFYLIVFFALPFITINGNPLFLFNVVERKFVLFSVVFWPQDFFLFGLGMLIFILFIALFTVVFGRVFCGWACPQTIFMEMVFRKIEYWIEGDASHQKILNKMPWNAEKILKKGSKNILFFLFAFIIANTFLSYIIGVEEVTKFYAESFSKHAKGFGFLLLFSGVFYGVYARFREQVCIVVCPYGRMQGVLLDKNSIVVAYDYVRGEPKGKFKKNETRTIGDCIDCYQCVKVCPTGIDIRNGTQLECTNCTACIDACDHMMESVGLPKGLIRYDSESGIAEGRKLRLTPRMMAYSAVLIILIVLESFLLATRTDLDITVIRARGMLYQQQPENKISNLYNIKMINKTRENLPVRIDVESPKGEIKMVGQNIMASKESLASGTFFVLLNKSDVKKRKTEITLGVYSRDKKIKTIKTSFLGPVSKKSNMNWGVKIILLYLGFVTLIISLVIISMNQKVDLVSPDYYAQELKYQEKIDGSTNYKKLTRPILYQAFSESIQLSYPKELIEKKISGTVLIYRPSDSSLDIKSPIQMNSEGIQQINSDKFKKGLYKIQVEWVMDEQKYFDEKNLFMN